MSEPIRITVNGCYEYRIGDRLHREDGPAIELSTGSKGWYSEGVIHRLDGPAWEAFNGESFWAIKGKFHSFETHILKLKELGYEEIAISLLWRLDSL